MGARGRPRSEAVDRALLAAARDLLAERGYARTTVDAVAARAGVGKAAIYRRYRDMPDLVAAAVSELPQLRVAPDTGSARGDAVALLRDFRRAIERFAGMVMVGTMLAEEPHSPELLERFRERVIGPRRALMRAVLARGVQRGELRAGADLELAADMLAGAYFARHLAGLRLPRDWAERVVDAALDGLAVR
jgi:AcrR family transcriptional regulator